MYISQILYLRQLLNISLKLKTFHFFKEQMIFTLNGADHKVELYGSYVLVDNTLFHLRGPNWNEALHRGTHVYTFHFKTKTMEIGEYYQEWYNEDQLPIKFDVWLNKKMGLQKDGIITWIRQNIKNIIIDNIVYKIEGASYVWPRPKLYLNGKHVGYIRENVVEWIDKSFQPS